MYRLFFKRFFDFMGALVLFLLISPVFVLISIIIKLGSEGPVFFRQERGGVGGTYFTLIKFRSMAVDRDAEKKGFEPGSKKRVTWIGRILRKTKLDELPQFINVIKGEMSLVGPRPEVKVYIDLYPQRWQRVLQARPGITDPASIKYRNEEEILAEAEDPEKEYREKVLPNKLDIYEDYVENISLLSDLRIIIATFFAVVLK